MDLGMNKPTIVTMVEPGVRPHRRLWHRHGGVKILARALHLDTRIQGRRRRFRMGTWCPYCGFNPGENARRLQQEVFEELVRLKGKVWPD